MVGCNTFTSVIPLQSVSGAFASRTAGSTGTDTRLATGDMRRGKHFIRKQNEEPDAPASIWLFPSSRQSSRDKGGERDLAGKSCEQAIAFGDKILVRNAVFGVARKFW